VGRVPVNRNQRPRSWATGRNPGSRGRAARAGNGSSDGGRTQASSGKSSGTSPRRNSASGHPGPPGGPPPRGGLGRTGVNFRLRVVDVANRWQRAGGRDSEPGVTRNGPRVRFRGGLTRPRRYSHGPPTNKTADDQAGWSAHQVDRQQPRQPDARARLRHGPRYSAHPAVGRWSTAFGATAGVSCERGPRPAGPNLSSATNRRSIRSVAGTYIRILRTTRATSSSRLRGFHPSEGIPTYPLGIPGRRLKP